MSTEQIINRIKKSISEFEPQADLVEVGRVVETHDAIAKISGLRGCQSSEMIEFESGALGLALNLEEDFVGAVIFDQGSAIKEGDEVRRTGRLLSVPVGSDMLGRVVDPLLRPIDGLGPIPSEKFYPVEKIAPGVMERKAVAVPLETGIKSIDSMIPIGRGQRELLIGDRQTGKTSIAIDTIVNQKGKGVVCVYVAISQKKSKVAKVVETLKAAGALEYTTVVLAGSSDPAAFSYIAPYSGSALAEYFMDQGQDVLIVYDDLSKHAVAYREISLLLRRPPGREAYPGDVFYLHSRLLERAVCRSTEAGGGSVTALPIIETQAGDISAYIPTNVISITDGQIFLETALFNKGIRPAINIGFSVSRVGSAAQTKTMKSASGRMKLDLAQYRELESFAQFATDLDPETKKVIERGRRITELLKQPTGAPLSVPLQAALFYAASNGYLDTLGVEEIGRFEKELTARLQNTENALLEKMSKSWNAEVEKELKTVLDGFEIEKAA